MKLLKQISTFLVTLAIVFSLRIEVNAQNSYANDDVKFLSRYSAEELLNVPVKLIPYPNEIQWLNEDIVLREISIVPSDELTTLVNNEFKNLLAGFEINFCTNAGYPVSFSTDNKLPIEGYEMIVDRNGIKISANNETGHYYALQTLRQLIAKDEDICHIQLCNIKDKPAYPIRGYMIDVGRNFQNLVILKKQLDLMAKYKLNTFHWHLTDRPAWRIESKKYPELTAAENHRPTRNPGKFYTYNEIREIIHYANERKITVIPEIDMPGHSDSFRKSMNCRMESPEGMRILENVLNEFFDEIPKELAPIIHIGSDEVKIPNPEEFILKMVSVVENDGREVIVWSPGLKAKASVIRQTWGVEQQPIEGKIREINSGGYLNAGEPMSFINTLFFSPIGANTENEVLGGIVCLWPDVNLENEEDAFIQNPYYSSILTHAWVTWTADVQNVPSGYSFKLPSVGTTAADYFYAFETYLLEHKERYFSMLPFNYYLQSDKEWKLIGPFNNNDGDQILEDNGQTSYLYNGKEFTWIQARGNTLVINQRWEKNGYYPGDEKAGKTFYALTYIHSNEEKEIDVWLGFETPLRANRIHTGIPENGEWDINGGAIYINDTKLPGPIWDNPGWRTISQKDWGSKVEQEIPWTEEEFYWTRKPAKIKLNKGWNKVFVKIPCATDFQNWMFTFVPLEMEGIRFSTDPK